MSSFLPTANEAHVCLRCHLRLTAGRARLWFLLRSPPTERQRRRFSVKPQRLQEHTRLDDNHLNEQGLFENPAMLPARPSYEVDDIKLPNDAKPNTPPKNSGYYYKRANLYCKDSLGITTLGRPAEVLRVQDAPPRTFERKWWLFQNEGDRSPNSAEPLTSSEILERVNSERGLVSAARAKENIEASKQEWVSNRKKLDLPPSEQEYYELGRKLHDGFTIKQLLGYFNEAKIPVTSDLTDVGRPFHSAHLTRSEWRAGITPFPGDALNRLQPLATDLKSRKSTSSKMAYTENMLIYEGRHSEDPVKYILVNKIIRQCWNIKPIEEVESVGEVDVRIREAHLELITSHKRDILRQVANEYDANIGFSKVVPVLRITATQSTCVSTLRLLSLILDEVACHEMRLGANDDPKTTTTHYRTLLNDRLLREAERLSSTIIRWPRRHDAIKGSDERLLVYYLGNGRTPFEDAQRFISQSMTPTHVGVTGSFFGGTQGMAGALISVPIEIGQGLPLKDRGTAWIRKVVVGNDKINNKQNIVGPRPTFRTSEALKDLEHHIRTCYAWRETKPKPPDYAFWLTNPHQETSAVLGRLLYPARTATSEEKQEPFINETTTHRVFSTDLPSLRRNLEAREDKMHVKEELYIRLSAATKQNSAGLESANLPDLELRFRLFLIESAVRRKAVLKGVRLILEKNQADLLLPHEQSDLRFQHQTYINGKEEVDPAIKKFVKSSNLDRSDVDQIETPQLLTISIPQQVLSPNLNLKQVHGSEIPIDYAPTSIERRCVLESRPGFNAHKRLSDLSYSTIDAGSIGGRRQEIRFFRDRPLQSSAELTAGKSGTTEKKSTVKALYSSALGMIRGLGAASRTDPNKPVSRRSLRRIRRVIQGHRGTTFGRMVLGERIRGRIPRGKDIRPLIMKPVVPRSLTDVNHQPGEGKSRAGDRWQIRGRARRFRASDFGHR